MSNTCMRRTDAHGRSLHRPEGARPVTDDGRLLWVGPILPHQQHEFFLDGVNLGSVTLEQAMEAYHERPLANFHVSYEQDPDEGILFYQCWAEDAQHAFEQTDNAYPGATLFCAVPAAAYSLAPGGEVHWNDPDQGLSSGTYTIVSIYSDSGHIDSTDTIVMLKNEAGSECEVLAHEIADGLALFNENLPGDRP